jgi:hypothetical protein
MAIDAWAAARVLEDASRLLAQLRLVRGTSRRTHRLMACTAAMVVAAASLLGATPARAATPVFLPPEPGIAFGRPGLLSKPAFADIDGDGDLDAFIGNAIGSTVFFENIGDPASPAFAASSENPFGLASVSGRSSPTFADIDGDGDLDAFIGTSYGTTDFFENTGNSSAPAFAAFRVNQFGLIDVGDFSSPAFADIDGDGDLDAFIGEGRGSTVFFENIGDSSSPAFANSSASPFGLASVGFNSKPTFVDIDRDGDLDAFVGNFNGDTIFFENTGNLSSPAFANSSVNPFGLALQFTPDVSRASFDRSSPAFADIDADGDLDAFIGSSYGTTVFFENTGNASSPAFARVYNPFALVDVGYNSRPAFADIDGDGDLDAFVTDEGRDFYGNTFFFENTGNRSAAAFAAPSAHPFGLSAGGLDFSPAFADIDGDGDLDAFIKVYADVYSLGATMFFENSGDSSSPAFAAPSANPFGLADVPGLFTPAFADIDGDGDLDAFSGRYFFENTGTSSSPAFAAGTEPFSFFVTPPAFADIDGDGDLDAFDDSSFFENTGNASSPAFAAPSPSPFNRFGFVRAVVFPPAFADIDGDGDLDAFIGEYFGNTLFFENRGTEPAPVCVGDCGGDGHVDIDEIVLGVTIALGAADASVCPTFDGDGNGQVTIDEIILAVDNALRGC